MNTEFNNFALTDFKRRQWYSLKMIAGTANIPCSVSLRPFFICWSVAVNGECSHTTFSDGKPYTGISDNGEPQDGYSIA